MRTVSFSSDAVQELLNERFVCARINTKGHPSAGTSFSHAPHDPPGPCLRGNGKQNVQILFLTPQAEIFHVLTGYVEPEELARELEFALDVFEAISSGGPQTRQLVVAAHTTFLTEDLGYALEEIERAKGDSLGMATLLGDAGDLVEDFVSGRNTPGAALTPGTPFAPNQVLDSLGRSHVLTDHRFAMDHPLLPWHEFRPEALVGNGNSFFGSTSWGTTGAGSKAKSRNRSARDTQREKNRQREE